jgi:5'-3' exoribonuclease 2
MLNSTSPIFNFYPRYFYVDPNGKRNSSQYVALLPFINEERLLEALQPVYSMLTSDEKKRNTRDHDRLFIHQKNLSDNFKKLSGNITENNPIQIQNILKGKLIGDVWLDDNDNIIHSEEDKKEVICFKYRDPLCCIKSLEKIRLI